MILDTFFGGLVLLKIAEKDITIIEFTIFTDMKGQHGRTPIQKRGVLELSS